MTADQWAAIVAVISTNWPHAPAPDDALAKWKLDLDDLDPQQVLVAVESLYRNGREFPPNGAQIRLEALKLTLDVPEWADVWKTLWSAASRSGYQGHAEARERMTALHDLAGVLFDRLDWREFCYGEAPPTVTEAQTRGKWEGLVAEAKRTGALQGLPSAGFRELERINSGPRRLGAGLRAIEGGKPA